jgi:hypothetical protein
LSQYPQTKSIHNFHQLLQLNYYNLAMMSSNHSRQGSDMNISSHSTRRGRIPAALQAIFLASNGGEEVHVPPKNLGFKVFSRILGGKNKKQVYEKPGKNVLEKSPEDDEVSQTRPDTRSSIFQSKESSKLTLSFPKCSPQWTK